MNRLFAFSVLCLAVPIVLQGAADYVLGFDCGTKLEPPLEQWKQTGREAVEQRDWLKALPAKRAEVSQECANEQKWLELAALHLKAGQTVEALHLLESLSGRGFDKLDEALRRTENADLQGFLSSAEFKKSTVYQKVFFHELEAEKRRAAHRQLLAKIPAKEKPAAVYSTASACPGDCCRLGAWTAKSTTSYYLSAKAKTPAGKLEKDAQVQALQSLYEAEPLPVAVVHDTEWPALALEEKKNTSTEQELPLRKGEILYFFEPIGEGMRRVWYKKKFYLMETYAAQPFCRRLCGSCWGEFVEPQKASGTSWVKIKVPSLKKEVWIKEPQNFDGRC